MLILGAHMSIAKGFAQMVHQTTELGCNALQFFTKSPRGGTAKPIDEKSADEFAMLCKKYQIRFVVAHSSYLLNFARPHKEIDWMIQDILLDCERVHLLRGNGIVVHIGKAKKEDRKKAVRNIIENTKYIIDKTEKLKLAYILENTAGQGSEIGFRFEELKEIWDVLQHFNPRLKACLDTAHLWAAGYDIGSQKTVQTILKEYDQMIGLKNIACFHFNDSRYGLQSKLDRHENIGYGHIGEEGLKAIAKFAETQSIPLILETPEKERTHTEDVKKVHKFLGLGIHSDNIP